MFSLAELAQKSAYVSPGSPALIDPLLGRALSFGDLDRRTELLALALSDRHGVGPGDRIAVLSRNCPELIELYLASARGGTLLFPLNWRFSAGQVADALSDARPAVVFYEKAFAPVADEVRGLVDVPVWVEIDPGQDSPYEELIRQAADRPRAALPSLPDPAATASCPFLAVSTGGTTGVPKSAVHSQASYEICMLDYLAAARIAETDVYMMLGQLFHVGGYMALAYLAMARPIVIMDFEAEACIEVIRAEQVSGFFAIATMLPRLLGALKASTGPIGSVRLVEYGGAPMGKEVIRETAQLFGADLMQAWGMTEFGPGTYLGPAAHRLALDGQRPELLLSCGQAALFSKVAVLDEKGVPVPKDSRTMGEICHRGPNNMVSYWNKPDETAEIMRDGWIRTGDGGTWDEDGHIFIVDRIKSMVISGGENIFPAEIERTLANHPSVSEVVVVGVPDAEWGEVIKAVVVPAQGANLTEQEVVRYVEDELGSYKKPRIVELLDELPVTPTGKVNRKLLRQSSTGRAPTAAR